MPGRISMDDNYIGLDLIYTLYIKLLLNSTRLRGVSQGFPLINRQFKFELLKRLPGPDVSRTFQVILPLFR